MQLELSAQTPTSHASNITFNNVYCQELSLSWTNGDGSQRIVLAKEGSSIDAVPFNNTFYFASDTFQNGDEIGVDNFVIYNGSGNSASVSNLKKNTTYYFAIFEFNGSGTTFSYLSSGSYATANTTTKNITASFTMNDSYQCLSGNSFSFNGSASNTTGGTISYSWDFGDKSTSSLKDPTYVYPAGKIYTVVLTASSTGCEVSTSLLDTVVVPFLTDFELDNTIVGNDSIQCLEGNNFEFNNLSKAPAKPIYQALDLGNYRWTTSDGDSGKLFDVNFRFDTPGLKRVKLVTRRSVKRPVEYCADSIEKVYVVLPPPIYPSDVTISDTALCLNDNRFDFSHSGSNVTETRWYFGDGDSSTGNPSSHSYSDTGKMHWSLKVLDVNGCTGTFKDSLYIFPEPDNFFSGLGLSYCQGDPAVRLVPNLSGGRFFGQDVNETDSTFEPLTLGTHTVSYVYSLGDCRDTFSQDVQVFLTPKFSLGNDTFLCSGQSITFSPSIGSASLFWSDNDVSTTKTISTTGTYWARATEGSCSHRDTINIFQLNPPSFSLGTDTTICGGQTISFDVQSELGRYMWNDGDTLAQKTITESGFYEVQVTNPCGTQSASVNIEILPFACEILVPNVFTPNGDGLNDLFRPLGFFQFNQMVIFNEYGERLFESKDENSAWDGIYMGEVVPQGIYYFVIHYSLPENGSMSKKVLSGHVMVIN